MNAKQRNAKRKASTASAVPVSVPTMTARTMLAARQAGSAAVRYSEGLAGSKSLKVETPYTVANPLSTHHEDRANVARKYDATARNPRDHQQEQADKAAAIAAELKRIGVK